MKINCRGKLLDLSTPKVMGIININSNSFYEGSRLTNIQEIVHKANKFITEGASIIDIGVMSSRPGAPLSNPEDEIEVLKPVLIELIKISNIIVSVDTVWSKTAKFAIEHGASVINDISGGNIDVEMLETVASFNNIPYIIMHSRGTPETMQALTQYEDLTLDIMKYFAEKINNAKKAGIKDIIIDPGLGFAKNIGQNFELLANLEKFKIFDLPILAGLSRKSMIYKTLNTDTSHALNGTTVLNTIALMKGAKILRVHDVKEATEVITLIDKLV